MYLNIYTLFYPRARLLCEARHGGFPLKVPKNGPPWLETKITSGASPKVTGRRHTLHASSLLTNKGPILKVTKKKAIHAA